MPRLRLAAMTALFILVGTFVATVSYADTRVLTSFPSTFGEVGDALFGAVNSDGSSSVEFGTSVALSSIDGRRLVVGAPGHDWATSDGTGSLNEDGGAVFVYDYDDGTLDWELKSFFHGNEGERMGDRLSLSSDGSMIALRRYNPDRVEVYSVDASGIQTKLGIDIACPRYFKNNGNGGSKNKGKGKGVALSPAGTRLAVSCEWTKGGMVRVYDIDQGDWVLVGTLRSEFEGGLSGWKTAFFNHGKDIALTAPNYDGRGFARVYRYIGTNEWTQIGTTLFGTEDYESFGMSMDISDDGTTLVVGSTLRAGLVGNTTHPAGAVSVYKLSTGENPDWELEVVFEGKEANDRFGRSVSVSDSGTRFVASSMPHNQGRGEIRVFELFGSDWGQVGQFEGTNRGDRLCGGIQGVNLSGDGSRLVAGSTRAASNGLVEVFSIGLTPQLSTSPSNVPTSSTVPPVDLPESEAPTAGMSLMDPGLTPQPSTSPSNVPTSRTVPPVDLPESEAPTAGISLVDPGPFSWDLARAGSAMIAFTEEATTSEIKLAYNITRRNTTIQLFEEDCLMEVPGSVASASGELTPNSPTHADLVVSVDIKQDSVVGSAIWLDDQVNGGTIRICVRVDLVFDDGTARMSVTFHEQILRVTVGLLQGFEVTAVNLDRLEASEESGDANFNYDLKACQCNESFECNDSILKQGDELFICVETEAQGVEIVDIMDLALLQQDGFSAAPIVGGNDGPLTLTTIASGGKKANIRYQLVSEFYTDPQPGNVMAIGTALLAFEDNSSRRRHMLRAALEYRVLEHGGSTGPSSPFHVNIALASSYSDYRSRATGHGCILTIVLVVGFAIALCS